MNGFVGGIAHLIGIVLLIYGILLIVRGLEKGDMIGTVFKAGVIVVAAAALMRL